MQTTLRPCYNIIVVRRRSMILRYTCDLRGTIYIFKDFSRTRDLTRRRPAGRRVARPFRLPSASRARLSRLPPPPPPDRARTPIWTWDDVQSILLFARSPLDCCTLHVYAKCTAAPAGSVRSHSETFETITRCSLNGRRRRPGFRLKSKYTTYMAAADVEGADIMTCTRTRPFLSYRIRCTWRTNINNSIFPTLTRPFLLRKYW